jgi:ribonuclease-3
MRADVESLEKRIGYCFTDRELLRRALTHRSQANDHPSSDSACPAHNEQLEFLGDSVLGFVASEMLVDRFPSYREGRLSKLKHHIVSAAHLHDVARSLNLGAHLLLGRSEEMSGGRQKKTLLANALEALIAAVYLDGGLAPARRFILDTIVAAAGPAFWLSEDALTAESLNYKSALQELAQAHGMPQPRYTILRERGPAHARTFTVEVKVGKEWNATGDGSTKKSAAQQAARLIYDQVLAAVQAGTTR